MSPRQMITNMSVGQYLTFVRHGNHRNRQMYVSILRLQPNLYTLLANNSEIVLYPHNAFRRVREGETWNQVVRFSRSFTRSQILAIAPALNRAYTYMSGLQLIPPARESEPRSARRRSPSSPSSSSPRATRRRRRSPRSNLR